MDTFLEVFGFPSWEINTNGVIRNKRTGRILKTFPDRYGYLRVSLGGADNVYVHKLMCLTFFGPPPFLNAQINHIDRNRQNNSIFNLEYCTPSENIAWSVRNGNIDPYKASLKALEVNRKPVMICETGDIFSSVKECAEFLGVRPTNVSRCLVGSRKGQALHGYHLKFVE